jgi:hypothetical protein
MPQVFRPGSNTIARVSLLAAPLSAAFLLWACLIYTRSSYGTGAEVVGEQPVPFSHQHHAGDLGIDCRYCHTSVERGPHAGFPATEICMNCHSQMWVGPLQSPCSPRDRRCAGAWAELLSRAWR